MNNDDSEYQAALLYQLEAHYRYQDALLTNDPAAIRTARDEWHAARAYTDQVYERTIRRNQQQEGKHNEGV